MTKKPIIPIALLVAAALLPRPAAAASVTRSGDTIEIVDGADTVRIQGAMRLRDRVTAVLDDTVLNLADDAFDMAGRDDTDDDMYSAGVEMSQHWARTVRDVASSAVLGVVIIVFLALLFGYLRRRRKYKMVEKAIECNYELPDYVFGGSRTQVRTVYMPQAGSQAVPPPFVASGDAAPASGDAVEGATPPPLPQYVADGRIDWRALKGGFVTASVGVGLTMFFAMAGAEALAGACTIIILLGLGKMWIAYQDQRAGIGGRY